MRAKKIIMADPELNYIVRLQIKFLQELQNSYEIDVITDKSYFEAFFKSPQNADCLIINEDWASASLAKHNIDHIILLTDGTAGDITSTLIKALIPRYTSTEEIYNQVRSVLGTESNQDRKKEASVIYFGSASGGTGKTVLALGLAEFLSRKYYRVLYINIQSVQSFHYYLKDHTPIPTEAAMALVGNEENSYQVLKNYIREERFGYLPPFGMPLFSYGISDDIFMPFIRASKSSKEYDYIIVDSGSLLTGTDTEKIALSDKVIMVLRPEPEYHFALKQLLGKISVKDEKLITLCNRASLNSVKNTYGDDSVVINECVSEWKMRIDSDSIHDFSNTDDIQKLAVLVG